MKNLDTLPDRFRRDARGNVALTFGLAAVPLILLSGMALDYSRATTNSTTYQAAIDAAALAAAAAPQDLSTQERTKIALGYLNANLPASDRVTMRDVDVSFPDTGVVKITVNSEIKTTLLKIAGIDTVTTKIVSEVERPPHARGEVVLVLDYSLSMTETEGAKQKYVAMREAAIKLVDELSEKGANKQIKFGLVPFSEYVYASLPKAYIAGESGSGTWSNCTLDRHYPYNVSDSTPTSNDDTKWGLSAEAEDEGFDDNSWRGGTRTSRTTYGDAYSVCNGYAGNGLVVRPLGTDHTATMNQLQAMKPIGLTNIGLGMEFGWHVLSPNLPFDQGSAYRDRKWPKAVVLLTDGRQTADAWGPSDSQSPENGEKNLETICSKLKDLEVTVVTIAFDLKDSATEQRLKGCASSGDDFFLAKNDADLAVAFKAIGSKFAGELRINQ